MFKKKFSDDEIRIKAHELWMAREGKGKTSVDDWNEAIEALEIDRSFIKRFCEWTGFKKKTGWDFLQLLIVPAVLSIGAFYLQYEAKQRDDKAAEDKAKQERKAAEDKAKQDTLTKYFDQMADLLLKEKLLQTLHNPDSEIFIIGRAKTITALQSLDPVRQHLVIQFLKSANLNGAGENSSVRVFKMLYLKGFLKKGLLYQAKMSNTDLKQANLNEADLKQADLKQADLTRANLTRATLFIANLKQANLIGANLTEATFTGANLIDANLIGANLTRANLIDANLIGAKMLNTNLTEANLTEANLTEATLINANLTGAKMLNTNLIGATLIGANLDIKQIENTCYWQEAKFSYDFRKQLDMSISQNVNPNCKYIWQHK